jgi:hypothetical protein
MGDAGDGQHVLYYFWRFIFNQMKISHVNLIINVFVLQKL